MMEFKFQRPDPMDFNGNLLKNWKIFLRKFKIFIRAEFQNNVEDKIKIAQLLNLIGDKGLEVFDTFEFKEYEEDQFKCVIDKFEKHFSSQTSVILERFIFYNIKQEEGQELGQFLQNLKKSVEYCEFLEPDNMVRDMFILGIRDKTVQENLLKQDLDLEKVENFCKGQERMQQLKMLRNTSEAHAVTNNVVDRTETLKMINNNPDLKYNSGAENVPEKSTVRVGYCLKKGCHLVTKKSKKKIKPEIGMYNVLKSYGLDYASAMVDSYFYGYLNIILPDHGTDLKGIKKSMDEFMLSEKIKHKFVPKIVVLVCATGYSENIISENDKRIEKRPTPFLSPRINRNGVERTYQSAMYKVFVNKERGEHVNLLIEAAPCLRQLYESSLANPILMKFRLEIIKRFMKLLQEKLDQYQGCKNKCEIIFCDENASDFSLADEILKTVNKI